VGLHGRLLDEQHIRDVAVREPARDLRQDLPFWRRQIG
jgi:hypothetical protein